MFGWLRGKKRTEPRGWRDTALFQGLSKSELDATEPFVSARELARRDILVREGEPASSLFVVRSGTLELMRAGAEGEHRIAEIHPGEVVGEMAVFDELPRFATARALGPCKLYEVALSDLRPRASRRPSSALGRAYRRLLENLAAALADRLRHHVDASVQHARHRLAVGNFLVNVLVLVCLYSFLLSGLDLLGGPANTSWVSIPLQLVFAVASWRIMRGSGYPLGEFGLGFRHLLGSLVEAAIFTLPVLALVTGMKGAVLLVTGNPQAAPLLEHPDVTARLTDPALLPTLAIYALSCFVQELVVRSAVQASLERFLVGPRHKLYAILVAALLFSMTHLHMSFLFALMAFVPGLFWGWLFARRRNIVGVTLSHIAVGAYVFFVLGVAV